MSRQFLSTTLTHSLVAAVLVISTTASLGAQASASPIRHSLYLALGGDPTSSDLYMDAARAVSAGVERSRAGSRWSMRLGADYRRQTSDGSLGSTRLEEFGVNLSARYGRSSGSIRPYLLGGVGIADLRTRVRDARYYADTQGTLWPPVSYDRSRWNGALLTGLGTDFTIGGVRLFAETRLNLYPAFLSTHPRTYGWGSTKALFLGVKF
jgi:Outer membrane protein beta-barrel domain